MNYSELIVAVTQLIMENQELKSRVKSITSIEKTSEIGDVDSTTHAKAKVFDAFTNRLFNYCFNTWNIDERSFEECLDSNNMKDLIQAGVTMDELKLVFMEAFLSLKARKQREKAEESDE